MVSYLWDYFKLPSVLFALCDNIFWGNGLYLSFPMTFCVELTQALGYFTQWTITDFFKAQTAFG